MAIFFLNCFEVLVHEAGYWIIVKLLRLGDKQCRWRSEGNPFGDFYLVKTGVNILMG